MILDVRAYLDDNNTDVSARWTDTLIINFINVSRQLVSLKLAEIGFQPILSSTTIQAPSGIGTLPAHERITGVQALHGSSYYALARGNSHGSKTITSIQGDLVVTYIAKTTAIAQDSPSPTVTYGGKDLNELLVDQYCAALTAYNLKSTENEANQQLASMIQVLEAGLNKLARPQVQIMQSNVAHHRVPQPQYRWSINTSGQLEIFL